MSSDDDILTLDLPTKFVTRFVQEAANRNITPDALANEAILAWLEVGNAPHDLVEAQAAHMASIG